MTQPRHRAQPTGSGNRPRDPSPPSSGVRSPHLLVGCALLGFAGAFALIAGNVVGSLIVPGHDWVADTVSDLAAGPYAVIQDVALYGYAAALSACAIGAAHDHPGGMRWSAGILCLMLLATVITIIGARNEYGDGDHAGIVVHGYLVYALGVLFVLAPLAMGPGMGRTGPVFEHIAFGCALSWAVGAPLFLTLPTSIDGLIERGLGLVTVAWVVTLSWLLLQRGRTATARRGP